MSKRRLVRLVFVGLIGLMGSGLWLLRANGASDDPKKVALLVGVNRYKTRILADKPLEYAERDVEELAKVLRGQGFEVRTLTGDRATKEGIDDALKETLKGRAADDLVVLGFAGHGVQMPLVDEIGKPVLDARNKPLSDAYFCPVNAVFGRGESMVSLTRLFERLNFEGGINLLLVDACRDNPDPNRSLGGRVRSLSGDELVGRLPGNSVILFSCSAGQRSLETSKAGGGHGVFFHHVIEGLKGEAADPATGEVGWDDLVGYVRKNVNRKAKEWEPALGEEADKTMKGRLQDPHQLSNLVATPVLAKVAINRQPVDMAKTRPVDIAPPRLPSRKSLENTVGMKLVLIPAGEFDMGSGDDDKEADTDEKPKHRVRITKPFYLGSTEVTQGQYRAVTGESPSNFNGSDDLPVEKVSWNDAIAFCNKLSEKEGLKPYYQFGAGSKSGGGGYRLPTEAEWEYACRAGSTTQYSFGDDASSLGEYAWFDGNSGNKTHPVGQKRPNSFGLYDMHGNVWEWVWDGKTGYTTARMDDPMGSVEAASRVSRGGSWDYDGRFCRSALRFGNDPSDRDSDVGFRVARVPQ